MIAPRHFHSIGLCRFFTLFMKGPFNNTESRKQNAGFSTGEYRKPLAFYQAGFAACVFAIDATDLQRCFQKCKGNHEEALETPSNSPSF